MAPAAGNSSGIHRWRRDLGSESVGESSVQLGMLGKSGLQVNGKQQAGVWRPIVLGRTCPSFYRFTNVQQQKSKFNPAGKLPWWWKAFQYRGKIRRKESWWSRSVDHLLQLQGVLSGGGGLTWALFYPRVPLLSRSHDPSSGKRIWFTEESGENPVIHPPLSGSSTQVHQPFSEFVITVSNTS